jgi:glycosyltransferase involved in cell wall biosynthesis
VTEIAFWAAALVVAYTWVGYPLLAGVLSRLARQPSRSLDGRPMLSVLIAAHNEAHCIEAKLRSTLHQRYPAHRLEVLVVSDGSSDGTDDLVAHYPDRRVRLIRQEPRAGKSSALNLAAASARGDILVFTDANALFAPDALARLAAPFHDPRVGLVTGQGLYGAWDGANAPRVIGNGYVRYEALVKRGESALGFVAGADGAIYALRRSLFQPLAPAEVNDLVHPIQAALAGYASRFDAHATTVEPPSSDGAQEFRRHVRIIAQGFDVLDDWLPRLLGARRWGAVWALLSHRVLRWLTAPFLVVALASNAVLAPRHTLYGVTLALQLAFYAVSLLGRLAERRSISLGMLALPYFFCVVVTAGVAGLVRSLRRGGEAVWVPAGRQAEARDRAA